MKLSAAPQYLRLVALCGLLFASAAMAGIPDYVPEPHPEGMQRWKSFNVGGHKYMALIGKENLPLLVLRGSVARIVEDGDPALMKPTGIKLKAKKVYFRGWCGETDLAKPTHGLKIQSLVIDGKLPLTFTGNPAERAHIDTEQFGQVAIFFRHPMNFADGLVLALTDAQYVKLRELLGMKPDPTVKAAASEKETADAPETE